MYFTIRDFIKEIIINYGNETNQELYYEAESYLQSQRLGFQYSYYTYYIFDETFFIIYPFPP